MKKYQEKITSLIESGAYNEAAQLFCNDYGLEKYNEDYTDYNKQSRKIWKLSCREYENVFNLFSDVMDELREII